MPSPKEEGLLANELARIIGAPKSSEVVVQCISVLCGGDLAFLDGIELSQLEMCLPAAVAKSVWIELLKRECFFDFCLIQLI